MGEATVRKIESNDVENVAIYQQQVYGNMSPKMKLDKMGNQTFESGTKKNKIVTTVMPVNSGIDSGNKGGSVKDRMALWNKKPKKVANEEKKSEKTQKTEENEQLRRQKEKAEKLKKEKAEREKQQKAKAEAEADKRRIDNLRRKEEMEKLRKLEQIKKKTQREA